MSLLYKLDILNSKLFADDVEVAYRIYITLYVYYLCVVKTSYDLVDSINSSNV